MTESDFSEQIKKPYDGDYSDLELSSNSSVVSEAEAAKISQSASELIQEAVEEDVDIEKLLNEAEESQFSHLAA